MDAAVIKLIVWHGSDRIYLVKNNKILNHCVRIADIITVIKTVMVFFSST